MASDALSSEPSVVYAELRRRCLDRFPADAEYIEALYAAWVPRLAAISLDTFAAYRLPAVEFLARSVRDVRTDAVLEWLDAYPDSICDMAHED